MTLSISSPAFDDGARVPTRHTCEGDDLSPPLQWDGAPQGTMSFVLLCEDPDAPAQLEAAREVGDAIDAELQTQMVEVDVAGTLERVSQIHDAVAHALPAAIRAPPQSKITAWIICLPPEKIRLAVPILPDRLHPRKRDPLLAENH